VAADPEQVVSRPADLTFLSGGGEMGALMRSLDWSASSLGAPADWPQALRTAVRLILNTRHPMYIWWGRDLACLYNDAYRQSIGPERHPGSLGRPGRGVWDEIWNIIGPQIEQVMTGRGATWHENALVPITRNGRREDVYWTYSYSPIDDETAPHGVGGVLVVCTETTQAVMAERRRVEEVERQRRLFQQAPSFMCMLRGPEHVVEFVNDSHRRLFDSDTWPGKPLSEAFPEIAEQGYQEILDRVYRTGERFVARSASVRFGPGNEGQGNDHLLDFVYEPMHDAAGRVTGIFCEGFDVTEQRAVEEALRHREEQLRLATDAAEIGLWDFDTRTDTLFWPPRVKAMFGISPNVDVSMRDFYAALHPEDRELTSSAFAAALDPARRALYDVEYRAIGKEDGIVRWVAAKGRAIFDADDQCVRVIGTAIDITARKEAESHLRELNETLERRVMDALAEQRILAHVFERTDALILVIDMHYRLLAINKAGADGFERMYGLRPKVGESLLDLLQDRPSHRADVKAAWDRALSGQTYVSTQDFGDATLQRRSFELRFEVLRDTNGVQIGAFQFAYDVTERLRNQARLAEAEEYVRQTQKFEAIGQLTGGIAHDFNNLLQVLAGGISILERQMYGDNVRRMLEGMRRATTRGASLTRQLLAFSRRQALQPEPVNLAYQIEHMRDILDRTLRGDVVVEAQLPEGLWAVLVDPNELELTVLNLCVNARDAMPKGGIITIRAENRAGLVREDLAGDFVALSIRDTGTGMSPEVMEHIFEPFFTTKEVGKGSGLGLAQVYGFAKQTGGTVVAESRLGVGTNVTLLLPRSQQQASPASPKDTENRAPRESLAGSILLVEDDEEVATLVSEMLREIGYSVTRAASSEAALGALADGRIVDLVFSDIMMPGPMNGFELAQEIRRRRPRQKILLTSGYPDAASRSDEDGGFVILRKPYEIQDLKVSLERALEKRWAAFN
jgi:PAS domain S-box-containing protein